MEQPAAGCEEWFAAAILDSAQGTIKQAGPCGICRARRWNHQGIYVSHGSLP